MDQRTDLAELNYLMELMPCNMTHPGSGFYNFSRKTAFDLIIEYRNRMLTIHEPSTIALLCLYIPTFLFALFGNLLVMYVVFKNQHMRRVKNMFLVNLAIADIAVTLVCIPMVAGQTVFRIWVYGEFMCKLSGYMQGWSVTCSIFTLTALSIDRYLAIKCPMSLRRLSSKCQLIRVLLIIWFLSGLFAGPILYIRRTYTVDFTCFDLTITYCIEEWPDDSHRQIYSILVVLITYVVPLIIIAVCYGMIGKTLCSDEFHRKTSDSSATIMLGRKRVARMLIGLIVVFIVCWLPYNVCSLSLDIHPNYMDSQVIPFTLWLGHAHSGVNPILYWFLNKSFRHCMRKVLACHYIKKSQRDSPSPQPDGDLGDLFRYHFSPVDHMKDAKPRPASPRCPHSIHAPHHYMKDTKPRPASPRCPHSIRPPHHKMISHVLTSNMALKPRPAVEIHLPKFPDADNKNLEPDVPQASHHGLLTPDVTPSLVPSCNSPKVSKVSANVSSTREVEVHKNRSPNLVLVHHHPPKESSISAEFCVQYSNDSTQPTSTSSDYTQKYDFCTTHSASV